MDKWLLHINVEKDQFQIREGDLKGCLEMTIYFMRNNGVTSPLYPLAEFSTKKEATDFMKQLKQDMKRNK